MSGPPTKGNHYFVFTINPAGSEPPIWGLLLAYFHQEDVCSSRFGSTCAVLSYAATTLAATCSSHLVALQVIAGRSDPRVPPSLSCQHLPTALSSSRWANRFTGRWNARFARPVVMLAQSLTQSSLLRTSSKASKLTPNSFKCTKLSTLASLDQST